MLKNNRDRKITDMENDSKKDRMIRNGYNWKFMKIENENLPVFVILIWKIHIFFCNPVNMVRPKNKCFDINTLCLYVYSMIIKSIITNQIKSNGTKSYNFNKVFFLNFALFLIDKYTIFIHFMLKYLLVIFWRH